MADKRTLAAQFRRAVQLGISPVTDETAMMAVASVYPEYAVGAAYKTGDVFRHGVNGLGDPQLFQVLQDHTSAEEWTPETAASLYKAVGVTAEGIPVWVQPLGATDAYAKGARVSHNGIIYVSTVDANVWEPGVYGWEAAPDA